MCRIHAHSGRENPLDATGVHPESYGATEKLLERQGFTLEDVAGGNLSGLSKTVKDYKKLSQELEIGEITLRDIVKELENLQEIREMRCQNRSFVRMCWI